MIDPAVLDRVAVFLFLLLVPFGLAACVSGINLGDSGRESTGAVRAFVISGFVAGVLLVAMITVWAVAHVRLV